MDVDSLSKATAGVNLTGGGTKQGFKHRRRQEGEQRVGQFTVLY